MTFHYSRRFAKRSGCTRSQALPLDIAGSNVSFVLMSSPRVQTKVPETMCFLEGLNGDNLEADCGLHPFLSHQKLVWFVYDICEQPIMCKVILSLVFLAGNCHLFCILYFVEI